MIEETTPLRARLLESVHLLVLSSFAVAQPLLSVLRTSPAFFVSHRSRPADIVALVLVLLLAPPLIAVAITNLVGLLGPRWRRSAQAVFVWIFCCLLALTLLSRLSHRTALTVPAAAAAAGLATLFYLRSSNVRQLLVIGALAPVVFALSFLLTAPVSLLLRPQPAAAARVDPTANSPVVFILFDEFPLVSLLRPDGTIDEERFPNFAALARRADWFPNASTVHPFTEEAVPALLSAGFPKPDAPPTATSYPNNLFTLFGSSYRVHAVERVTHMCPDSICGQSARPARADGTVGPLTKVSGAIYLRIALPGRYPSQPGAADPFGEFLPPQNPAEPPAQPNAENAPPGTVKAKDTETVVDPQQGTPRDQRVDQFLADLDAQDRTLHFLHILIPHAPFEYLPSGRSYEPGPPLEGLRGEFWDSRVDWFAEYNWQRHLLQVGYADHVIGQLMARLDQLGILDKTMIVVTADHGACYRPGQAHRRAQEGNKYEIGLVPLFIKAPHQSAPVVNTTHIRTIDVIPTAAGMLGITLPWVTAGRDMLAEPSPPVELRITDAKHRDSVVLDQPEAGARAAVAERVRLFGSGGSINDLYAFGPNGDLVGQSVSAFGAGPAEGAVHVSARPATGTVPAFVNGLVAAPAEPGGWIAIAVNGTVRATVPAMALPGDRTRFIAVVPDAAFVEGDNTLTALAVTGSGDQRRVEPIRNWTYLGTRLPP